MSIYYMYMYLHIYLSNYLSRKRVALKRTVVELRILLPHEFVPTSTGTVGVLEHSKSIESIIEKNEAVD